MKKKIKKAEDGVKTNLIGVKSQGRSEGRVNMAEREKKIEAKKQQPSTPVKRNDGFADYMKTVDSTPVKTTTVEKQKGSGSTSGSKGSGTKGVGSSAPKSGSTPSAKTETKSAPKAVDRTQKITPKEGLKPIALPERKKPTVAAREYSETERKINQQIEKIRKGEGSTEAAQSRILALKAKEKRAGEKVERQKNRSNRRAITKSVRAGKFNKRVIAKSAK